MKHNWTWFYRKVNEQNLQLLLNFKKHLLVKELKEKTIHEYQKEVSNWMKFLQDKEIKTLDATIDELKEYLDNMDVSEARKTRVISVLSVFYKHNSRKGYIKKNIVEEYRNK